MQNQLFIFFIIIIFFENSGIVNLSKL